MKQFFQRPFPFRISSFIALIFSSGILFPIIGKIENDEHRYKVLEIFLWPSKILFAVPEMRFHSQKELLILNSYVFITPLALFLASFIWTIPVALVRAIILGKHYQPVANDDLWRSVFLLASSASVIIFFLYFLMPMDCFLPYADSGLQQFIAVVNFVLHISEIIPGFLASLFLDSGGDTPHGSGDLQEFAKSVHAFGPLFWSFVFIRVRRFIAVKHQINRYRNPN